MIDDGPRVRLHAARAAAGLRCLNAVNPAVGLETRLLATLLPFSASWEMYRTPPGRPTFPGIGVIGVKSWQKPRKNRGQSESSPRCLNAVNPAVALSAPKY